MSVKVILDDVMHQVVVYPNIRHTCANCNARGRRPTVDVRVFYPFKKEVYICYECMLKMALSIDKTNQKAAKAKKRIATNAQKDALKKAREAKERKKNGVLPQVLADAKSQTSSTKKENGCCGTGDGRALQAVVSI